MTPETKDRVFEAMIVAFLLLLLVGLFQAAFGCTLELHLGGRYECRHPVPGHRQLDYGMRIQPTTQPASQPADDSWTLEEMLR